ncbi:MAG: GIY-YIG nuclease family protein [Candidatus Omnitrophica bacterium]|nr:GIY-YIG nuclease family protein [Candidatus Omnitrophota bacterium]
MKPKLRGRKIPWFIYVVLCSDGSLYTGITTDILRRVKEHNSKKGAFYTKNKIPVKLVYQEDAPNRSRALKREFQIKRLNRKEKLTLIGLYL